MATEYAYELWDGHKVIGYYKSYASFIAKGVVFYEESPLKQRYGRHPKSFEVPTMLRLISQDHQDIVTRLVLDVRRKSQRQRDIIMGKTR